MNLSDEGRQDERGKRENRRERERERESWDDLSDEGEAR